MMTPARSSPEPRSRIPDLLLAFLLVAPAMGCAATSQVACALIDEPQGEIERCARVTADGTWRVSPEVLARLHFDRDGLAGVVVDGFAYVRRDGRALGVATMDNGPDYFSEGLVRFRQGAHLGYADRRLKVVIPAQYDGALPFHHGRASVCIGCRTVRVGEHSEYQGGRNLCLDHRGARHPLAECASH